MTRIWGTVVAWVLALWQALAEHIRYHKALRVYLRGAMGFIRHTWTDSLYQWAFAAGWQAFRPDYPGDPSGRDGHYKLLRGLWFAEWRNGRPLFQIVIDLRNRQRYVTSAFSGGWRAARAHYRGGRAAPMTYHNPNRAFGLQPGETPIPSPTRLPSDLPLSPAGAISLGRRRAPHA